MAKCFYCGKEYNFHEGTIVVDAVTGTSKYFCSRKCRANSEMKRKKKKWAVPR